MKYIQHPMLSDSMNPILLHVEMTDYYLYMKLPMKSFSKKDEEKYEWSVYEFENSFHFDFLPGGNYNKFFPGDPSMGAGLKNYSKEGFPCYL